MDEAELVEILSDGRFGGFIKREYAKYLIANEQYHKRLYNVQRGARDQELTIYEKVERGDKLPDEAHLKAAWRDYQLLGRQGAIQRAENRKDFEEAARQKRSAKMTSAQFEALAFLIVEEHRTVPVDKRRYYESVKLTPHRQRFVRSTTASAAHKANRVFRLVLDGRPRAKYSQGAPRYRLATIVVTRRKGRRIISKTRRRAKIFFDPHTGEQLHRFWLD